MCLICEVKNTKLKSSVTTTYKIRSGATVRRTKPAWIQDEITRPTQLKCSDVTSLFDCLRYCPNNVTVHYRNSPPQKKTLLPSIEHIHTLLSKSDTAEPFSWKSLPCFYQFYTTISWGISNLHQGSILKTSILNQSSNSHQNLVLLLVPRPY